MKVNPAQARYQGASSGERSDLVAQEFARGKMVFTASSQHLWFISARRYTVNSFQDHKLSISYGVQLTTSTLIFNPSSEILYRAKPSNCYRYNTLTKWL
jgi:hypothetical protein